MIQLSDDIVIATGAAALVERNERGAIVTRFTLRIESVLKGSRASRRSSRPHRARRTLRRPRHLHSRHAALSAGPALSAFHRDQRRRRAHHVRHGPRPILSNERQRTPAARSRRDIEGFNPNFDVHVERARDAAAFLTYIRGIVAQNIEPEPRYLVDGVRPMVRSEWETQVEATRGSYLMTDSGRAFRWAVPNATIVKAGIAVGDGWRRRDDPGAGPVEHNRVRRRIRERRTRRHRDRRNREQRRHGRWRDTPILFNDPNDQVARQRCRKCRNHRCRRWRIRSAARTSGTCWKSTW